MNVNGNITILKKVNEGRAMLISHLEAVDSHIVDFRIWVLREGDQLVHRFFVKWNFGKACPDFTVEAAMPKFVGSTFHA